MALMLVKVTNYTTLGVTPLYMPRSGAAKTEARWSSCSPAHRNFSRGNKRVSWLLYQDWQQWFQWLPTKEKWLGNWEITKSVWHNVNTEEDFYSIKVLEEGEELFWGLFFQRKGSMFPWAQIPSSHSATFLDASFLRSSLQKHTSLQFISGALCLSRGCNNHISIDWSPLWYA